MNLCYSRDDESFNFSELGDLMDDLASDDALQPGTVYYEADCTPMTPEYLIDACLDHFLEDCDQAVYDEVGEVYDNDFSGTSKEAQLELRALILRWAEKHIKMRYWRIDGKSRQKTFTKEEIEEYFT